MVARLKLEGLSCVRGGRTLFAGLELALDQGEALVVRGPNGVGKSSLLRVIAGLLPPCAGRVIAQGRIALADRALALDGHAPLGQALGFWAKLDGGNAKAGMAAMDLSLLGDVPVRMFSSGQRQRATLARVIAAQADIWLLDEPSNTLDATSVALLEASVATHRSAGGIAVIASHVDLMLPDSQILDLRSCA